MARLLLPLTFAALLVMVIVWLLQRREWERAREALLEETKLNRRFEQERNQAREEVFRRLQEDRELNKEKFSSRRSSPNTKNTPRWRNWRWARRTD